MVETPNRNRRLICLIAVFCFLTAFIFNGCDRGDSPRATKPAETTKMKQKWFQIEAPGTWTTHAGDDAEQWIYRRADDSSQITASVLITQPLNRENQERVLQKYVEFRQSAEKEVGGSSVVISVVTRAEHDGVLSARYQGYDPATNRRFSCLLLVGKTVAEAFYFEKIELDQAAFDTCVRQAFDSIALVEADTKQ